jgi:surface polysaccharide O-acyltransferase-like enzyme
MQLSKAEKRVELELIRAIAIACVVYIHVASVIVKNLPEVDQTSWFVLTFFDAMVRWCVPVFIMVSGSLLLQKSEPHTQFVKKRLSRVGLPLVIWLPLYWIGVALFEPPLPNIRTLVNSVLFEQPYLHFYFLIVMVQLALLTPWLRSVVRSLTRRSLALLTILLLYIGIAYQSKTTSVFYLFIPYLGYYLYGHLTKNLTFRKHQSQLIALSIFVVTALIMVVAQYFLQTSTIKFFGMDSATDVVDYLSPAVLVLSLLVFPLLNTPAAYQLVVKFIPANIITSLGECSFGIYLIHPIIQLVLVRLIPNLYVLQMNWAIPATLLLTVGIFLTSWSTAWLIKQIPQLRWSI